MPDFWSKSLWLPILLRQNPVAALEGGGELALAVISDLSGDLGDGETGAGEKLRGTLHPMLLHMGSERIAVHGFEDRLERGGVHVKLSGEGVDGDFLIEMLKQILMDLVDEFDLIGTAVGQKNGFLGAGDAHGLLNHVMKQLDNLAVAGAVEDLLAFTVADDEAAVAQRAKMVRHRRTGHVQHGGDVDDAFLTVTEHPENAQTGGIAELVEELRDHAEFLDAAESLLQKQAVMVVGVAMRQNRVGHGKTSFGPFGSIFLPIGRKQGRGLDFSDPGQYTADTTNKQVLNC